MRKRGLPVHAGSDSQHGVAAGGTRVIPSDRQVDGVIPTAPALFFGAVAAADQVVGDSSSSDSGGESDVQMNHNAVVPDSPATGVPLATASTPAPRDATSEEEDACGDEDLGRFYDQDSETELFGAIEPGQRKEYYDKWRAGIDEIELGYG